MKVQCPQCGQSYSFDESFQSKEVVCDCGHTFTVSKMPERILFQGGPCLLIYWKRNLMFLISIALMIACLFLFNRESIPHQVPLILIGIFFLVALISAGSLVLEKISNHYIITDRSITCELGWLSTEKTMIRISNIRSVCVKQSFCMWLVGIGNIEVASSASSDDANILLHGIPHAKNIATQLNDIREVK